MDNTLQAFPGNIPSLQDHVDIHHLPMQKLRGNLTISIQNFQPKLKELFYLTMQIMNFCFKCIDKCYTPMKYISFDAYLIIYADHDLELKHPAEGNQRINSPGTKL